MSVSADKFTVVFIVAVIWSWFCVCNYCSIANLFSSLLALYYLLFFKECVIRIGCCGFRKKLPDKFQCSLYVVIHFTRRWQQCIKTNFHYRRKTRKKKKVATCLQTCPSNCCFDILQLDHIDSLNAFSNVRTGCQSAELTAAICYHLSAIFG